MAHAREGAINIRLFRFLLRSDTTSRVTKTEPNRSVFVRKQNSVHGAKGPVYMEKIIPLPACKLRDEIPPSYRFLCNFRLAFIWKTSQPS